MHPVAPAPPAVDDAAAPRLVLRDGTVASVRRSTPADREALRRFFHELSPESRRKRFFTAGEPPHDDIEHVQLRKPGQNLDPIERNLQRHKNIARRQRFGAGDRALRILGVVRGKNTPPLAFKEPVDLVGRKRPERQVVDGFRRKRRPTGIAVAIERVILRHIRFFEMK